MKFDMIEHACPTKIHTCGTVFSCFVLQKEICSSLVLSMLQQMLEDRAEEIRQSAVKSLGLVFSLIDDTDKYNQVLNVTFSWGVFHKELC